MLSSSKVIPLFLLAGALAGCANTQSVTYHNLASAQALVPNSQDKDERIPFLFTSGATDLRQYTSVILDPVALYVGPDNQFGSTSIEDERELAAYMHAEFGNALKKKYVLANAPGPHTLRIRATLTGVETSTPVLSTLTKLAPMGLVVNTVQTARDKQASFTGSVTYAVEIYDSASDRLLLAYISKQYPWAENVATSFGTLDASKSGIRKGADGLLARLQ